MFASRHCCVRLFRAPSQSSAFGVPDKPRHSDCIQRRLPAEFVVETNSRPRSATGSLNVATAPDRLTSRDGTRRAFGFARLQGSFSTQRDGLPSRESLLEITHAAQEWSWSDWEAD